jgi:hypothetical protein
MTEVQLSMKLEDDALTIWRIDQDAQGGHLLGEYLYPELVCANVDECYVKIGRVIVEGLRDDIFDRIAAPGSEPVARGLTDADVAAYLIDISVKTQTRAHVETISALLDEESEDPQLAHLRASWPTVRDRLASFPG